MDTPVFRHARGKLGVMPRPAPPVGDPIAAARAIGDLAMTGRRSRYLGWAGPLVFLDRIAPATTDRFLHHIQGFTYSELPPSPDNLASPRPPYTVRDGWADDGIRGVTFRDTVRVLPWESLLAAATTGFIASRLWRRITRDA